MNSMNIKTYAQTVEAILADRNSYLVPQFQRNFSWGEEQQEDFWNDIKEIYRDDTIDTHFIGSMVFSPQTQDNVFKILDGQQRFATILIFLSSLRDTINSLNIPNKIDWIKSIQENLATGALSTITKVPKLNLNKQDVDFFHRVIFGTTQPIASSK